MILFVNLLVSQNLTPFSDSHKWGFNKGETAVIKPEYDTVLGFDATQQIALVANHNKLNQIDFYYITANNIKIKIQPTTTRDSVFTFSNQAKYATYNADSSSVFRIEHNNLVYLISKKGNQLTRGFDSIYRYKKTTLFYVEKDSTYLKEQDKLLGLIDITGKPIIPLKYKHITINMEDSTVYCCSAIFNFKLSDDVYTLQGKLIYSNKKHIEYSSKHIHVYKVYEPKALFMVENNLLNDLYGLEGDAFKYIKHNKAVVRLQHQFYMVNLLTGKKNKINDLIYFMYNYYTN